MTVGWLDCSAGASGDMLLGALASAGVPLDVMQAAAAGVVPGLRLEAALVDRAGLAATKVDVHVEGADASARTWRDVRQLLDAAPLTPQVASSAQRTFELLAQAEAVVHGSNPDDVHFHEVGALDAIADIVGVCAGLHHLVLTELHASTVSLGAGIAQTSHGPLPVPAPATLAVLTAAGAPVQAGPGARELCTPTGAALLAAHVTTWGGLPPMRPTTIGVGAGTADPSTHPNALRLVLGDALHSAQEVLWTLEANVDDLDPRLWPTVLDSMLEAGALDVWLTPILMKKGRPAHTVSALVTEQQRSAVERALVTETTTIGVRRTQVDGRLELGRRVVTVDVHGCPVRVKVATFEGADLTATPEWEDVRAAAQAARRPVREVAEQAASAASALARRPS